jgi:hypothetical protein
VSAGVGALARRLAPGWLKARLSARTKARLRAALGLEPWPDLAIRHPLFRSEEFRRLRQAARGFDVPHPIKPVLERGHQTSFVLSRWFAQAGVGRAFQVGYADGRHLFYLSSVGIQGGGTDLPADMNALVQVPPGTLDAATLRRLLRIDFFQLTPADVGAVWVPPAPRPLSVLFSDATFETLLPWRRQGATVKHYLTLERSEWHARMHEAFPRKVGELQDTVDHMVFIEPEPDAGGAGEVFAACARRLGSHAFSVWRFRPPMDHLFRLSPSSPVRQVVYAFTRDPGFLEPLRAYAEPD